MNRNFTYPILCLLAAFMLLTSCGEDRTGEYKALTQEDHWIEQQMQNIYLWYEDMPVVKEQSYFAKPKDFFASLLSKKCRNGKGDSFSYLESDKEEDSSINNMLTIDEKSSYGFDFVLYNDPTGTTSHKMARVLFVIPNSPAYEAGLKRGDWILKVSNYNITDNNYGYLLKGEGTTLSIAKLNTTINGSDITTSWGETSTITLSASRAVSTDPFYCTHVFKNVNNTGKNVGYLMYDSFSTGDDNNPTKYNDKMKEVFADFKTNNVNEFILDLRYNRGGSMSCITELCSLLAPTSTFGQTLYSLKFNNKNTKQDTTCKFNADFSAENLNLPVVYIITSPHTASASETTIYCLSPYMQVNTIGATTVGKNVASQSITSPYEFTIHPIVATVYNCNNESNFENGIQPTYFYNELVNSGTLGTIGDPNSDSLLNYTFQWIFNGSLNLPTSEAQASRAKGISLTPLHSSLTLKRKQGNIIAN